MISTNRNGTRLYSLIIIISLCAAFFGSGDSCLGANHYIREGAGGDGSDWANAWSDLPDNLTRGDTYYIADGNYAGYTFNDAPSGSTWIRIKKAIESDHGTDGGWSKSYGNGTAVFDTGVTFTTSYWEFDGQVRGRDWLSGYGFKISYSGTSRGVKLLRLDNNPSYITVKYTDLEHAGAFGDRGHDCVYSTSCSRFVVSRCYLHDVGRVPFLFRSSTDVTIEYCYVARNESTPAEHSEGISAYSGTNSFVVRFNVWEKIEGTGVIMFAGDDWEVYGNLLFDSVGNNGTIATWTGYAVNNARVHNNSMIDISGYNGGFRLTGVGNVAFNNLFYNCSGGVDFTGVEHDYSLFDDGSLHGEPNGQIWAGGNGLFVDYDADNFHLAGATNGGANPGPALASGANMSTAPGSTYRVDMDGNTRGADGIWDRGAYEY